MCQKITSSLNSPRQLSAPFLYFFKGKKLHILISFFLTFSSAFADSSTLSNQLEKEYGLVAINQTDTHATPVLHNLLVLLKNAFPQTMIRNLKNLRYVYAYAGHDNRYNLGAFHAEAKALSIGGKHAYPSEEEKIDVKILSTLAHEIGHAFLLEKISAEELESIAKKFGGWLPVFGADRPTTIYSADFFKPHPRAPEARHHWAGVVTKHAEDWKKNNLCSRLATANVHEWFADAFAAVALQQLAASGILGKKWQQAIVLIPERKNEYWWNYNNISPEFSDWLQQKMRGI